MVKTNKPKTKKKIVKAKTSAHARKLPQPTYKSFRFSKRIKHPSPKLPNSFSLTKMAITHLYRNKVLFAYITAIYLLLTLILIRGFIITSDLEIAKESITELISGSSGQIAASLTVFGVLLSSTTPASQVGALYQTILVIIFSLVIIWALRQTHAGVKISLKDSFYKSSYPLIQFLLVMIFIGLQLLPLLLANFLYSATIASGLSTTGIEIILWASLSMLLAVWSVYMISSSLFALYIVTLPDMTPRKALRSAKGLVQYRRWNVMRKVLFIPLAATVIGFIIVLPIILIFTPAAEILFLLLSSAMLVLFHSYVYALYRELLA